MKTGLLRAATSILLPERTVDLARLDELKRKLQNDRDLAPIYEFFLDHFGEKPEFHDEGTRTRHEFLESVVAQVVCQALQKKNCALVGLTMTEIPDRSFIHGGFLAEGRVGGLLWFDDIETGLVALCALNKDESKFARFKGKPLPRQAKPSVN